MICMTRQMHTPSVNDIITVHPMGDITSCNFYKHGEISLKEERTSLMPVLWGGHTIDFKHANIFLDITANMG